MLTIADGGVVGDQDSLDCKRNLFSNQLNEHGIPRTVDNPPNSLLGCNHPTTDLGAVEICNTPEVPEMLLRVLSVPIWRS